MKTLYYTATSLDGFIADSKHSLDWLFQFGDGPPGDFDAFLGEVGAIVMGSTTYRWLLDHLPAADGGPTPWPYHQPTWVFSSRDLPILHDADIRFVRGDVAPVHAAIAAVTAAAGGGHNVWIVGGGDLAGQFHDRGLLDEIIVDVASVTLGAGAPLLPRRITTPPLRLLSAEAFGDGFARLVYAVGAGAGVIER